MSNKINKPNYVIDIIIVGLIALCLIFLMIFANNKLSEVITSDREALLIEHDQNNPIHEELAQKIVEFRPDACKMIEVYSEDYEPIFRVQFKDNDEHMDDPLKDHTELTELFDSHEDGHTEIEINGEDEDVYFRWTITTTGERCLFIIYMSRPVVKNLWVFTAICCVIMFLVMILLFRTYQHKHEQALLYLSLINISEPTRPY